MLDESNFIRRKASIRTDLGRCCACFSSARSLDARAKPIIEGRLRYLLLPIFRPVGEISGFFSMSKSVCADCEDDSASVSRYIDAAMRRGKGKVVFIQAQR